MSRNLFNKDVRDQYWWEGNYAAAAQAENIRWNESQLPAETVGSYFNQDYVFRGRNNEQLDIDTSNLRNLSSDERIKYDSYRFGKAMQTMENSLCPESYRWTPISYHRDYDTRAWPWDINPNYEDPVYDNNNLITCCNRDGHRIPMKFVERKNAYMLDTDECKNNLYQAYKQQESEFTHYVNTYFNILHHRLSILNMPHQSVNNLLQCNGLGLICETGPYYSRKITLTVPFATTGYCGLINLADNTIYGLGQISNNPKVIYLPKTLNEGLYRAVAFRAIDTRGNRIVPNPGCYLSDTIAIKSSNIFNIMEGLEDGILSGDLQTIYIVLQTYDQFFSNPKRIIHFNRCVCRGNAGHSFINTQINSIHENVTIMLQSYGLTDIEKVELFGPNGTITKLSSFIDSNINDDWFSNTCMALRRWISFNYRVANRIENSTNILLVDQEFYKVIQYVIKSLLLHLKRYSQDEVSLLQLIPTSTASYDPSSIHDDFFIFGLSYLIKDETNKDILLSLGDRLTIGTSCDSPTIIVVCSKMLMLHYTDLVKLLIKNLVARYNCKDELRGLLYTPTKELKQQLTQVAYSLSPKAIRQAYKNMTNDQQVIWSENSVNSLIKQCKKIIV